MDLNLGLCTLAQYKGQEETVFQGVKEGFEPPHLPHPTPRLAGAPDISPCPQSRKDVLFAKAHEVFRNASTVGEYYYLIRPYLGEP